MYAFALVYHQRIHQIVLIKGNGIVADRTYETLLEQPDVIVVDVDVGKDIGKDST